jgi:hypothetical protein
MADLCERCRELITSDRSLNIPDVQRPTLSNAEGIILDYDTAHTRGITYQLVLEDTYPDFPVLKSSAEAGCVFCGFLRDCVQEKQGKYLEDWRSGGCHDIAICGLSYRREQHSFWIGDSDAFNGLHYLIINLKVHGSESPSIEYFLTFDILADEGSYHNCWKLRHTQYSISHWIMVGAAVRMYCFCLSSLLLSEFSCQGGSPTPAVYSPGMDLISQPRSYIPTEKVP